MRDGMYQSLLVAGALALAAVVGAGLFYSAASVAPIWLRRAVFRSALVAAGVLLVLLPAEAYFRCCVVESDGINRALASRLWMIRYWGPMNSLGYRDDEHGRELESTQTIIVLGDSFAAGHGIEDYRLRFSSVLDRELEGQWSVVTIARNGWSTEDELAAIRAYPGRPSIVVLGYHVNDIEAANARLGRPGPPVAAGPSGPMGVLVERSYLANYAFWRLYRRTHPELGPTYRRWLTSVFHDDSVWQVHAATLREIVDYAHAQQSQLVVVLFPELADPRASVPLTGRVRGYFSEEGVQALDFAEILADRDPRQLMVSSVNPHPSVQLHREIGERLAQLLRSRTG